MTLQPASRKYDDAHYGRTGFWYYRHPAWNCVFKTDYSKLTFIPTDEVEELTLLEYIDLQLAAELTRTLPNPPPKKKDVYYYVTAWEREVLKSTVPADTYGTLEISAAEYIELSILWNLNPEDTLL